jgi:hypothetical protein
MVLLLLFLLLFPSQGEWGEDRADITANYRIPEPYPTIQLVISKQDNSQEPG